MMDELKKNINYIWKISSYVLIFLTIQAHAQHTPVYQAVDSLLKYDTLDKRMAYQYSRTAYTEISNDSTFQNDSVRLFVVNKIATFSYEARNFPMAIKFGQEEVVYRDSLKTLSPENEALFATSLNNLAMYYFEADSFPQSKNYFKKSLKAYKELTDPCSTPIISTKVNLGYALSRLNQIDSTLIYFEDARACLLDVDRKPPIYASILESLGYLYSSLDSADLAIQRFGELFRFFEAANYPYSEEKLETLLDYSRLIYKTGRITEADSLYTVISNLRSYQNLDNNQQIAILERQAGISLTLNKVENAVLRFKQLLEKNEADTARPVYLNQLAFLSRKQEKLDDALWYYQQSFDWQQNQLGGKINDTYLTTVSGLGNLYIARGSYRKAESLYDSIVNNEIQHVSNQLASQLWQNYASLKFNLGEYAQSEEAYQKAETFLKEKDMTQSLPYATLENNRGALYEAMGNYKEAILSYAMASTLFEELNGAFDDSYITTLSNLANTFIKSDSLDAAERLLLEVIQKRDITLGKEHELYGTALNNLASLYEKRERFEAALTLYKEATTIKKQTLGPDHPDYAIALNNLGFAFMNLDKYDSALIYFKEAEDVQRSILPETHPDLLLTLNNICSVYGAQRNYQAAEPILLDIINKKLEEIDINFATLSEKEKALYVKENEKFLSNFKQFALVRSGYTPDPSFQALDPKPAILSDWYNIELNTKGMLLNSTIKIRQQILNSQDESLIKAFEEWTKIRNEIALANSMTKDEQETINLDSLVQQSLEMEKSLTSRSILFGEAYASRDVNWRDIQSALDKDEAAIEIIRMKFDTTIIYVGLVISRNTEDHPAYFVLQNGTQIENKYLNSYRNAIKFKVEDPYSYQNFWEPITEQIEDFKKIDKIYVSPDGVFHQINLNTLFNADKKRYVLDETAIVQVTSTKEIPKIKKQAENQEFLIADAVLIGRPDYGGRKKSGEAPVIASLKRKTENLIDVSDLPGTEIEVDKISNVLKDNNIKATVVKGADANEEYVKSLSSPPILHIATHGVFFEDSEEADPLLQSGLLFAGVSRFARGESNSNEDGILTAYEVMNMSFDSTRLIVLSACNTGQGVVSTGEGVYGLQRAFKVAGASSLIMSLWQVDDQATQQLMVNFYTNLLEDNNRRAAFVKAQEELRDQYPNPYFWGAFVMIE